MDDICDSVSSLDIHCNAGLATADKVGDFPGYGTVWFHPDGIANILSLARVKEKYRVTSTVSREINLWYTKGMEVIKCL